MRSRSAIFALVMLLATVGCRKEDMSDQPKFYKPYKQTVVFADGTTARPIPEGTVARGHLQIEADHFTGIVDGKEIDYIPIPISRDDLKRGQQQFIVFCSPCHGEIGNGQGMIVQRGMVPPPSFVQLDRPLTPREKALQSGPLGHYFNVITNGLGAMYSYNDRISPDDRWRITAYVRALQLSQNADMH